MRLKVCDIVSLLWPFYVAVAVAVCVFFCSLSATKNGVIINRCLARDADLDNPLLVHFVFFLFYFFNTLFDFNARLTFFMYEITGRGAVKDIVKHFIFYDSFPLQSLF